MRSFTQRRQAVERERWQGNRPCRQSHQRDFVVIRSDAVGFERAAGTATVDYRPIPAWSCPDRHGFHRPTTFGGTVPWLLVHMLAPEAERAVVAVFGPGGTSGYRVPAMHTGEPVGFVPSCALFTLVMMGGVTVFLVLSRRATFLESFGGITQRKVLPVVKSGPRPNKRDPATATNGFVQSQHFSRRTQT